MKKIIASVVTLGTIAGSAMMPASDNNASPVTVQRNYYQSNKIAIVEPMEVTIPAEAAEEADPMLSLDTDYNADSQFKAEAEVLPFISFETASSTVAETASSDYERCIEVATFLRNAIQQVDLGSQPAMPDSPSRVLTNNGAYTFSEEWIDESNYIHQEFECIPREDNESNGWKAQIVRRQHVSDERLFSTESERYVRMLSEETVWTRSENVDGDDSYLVLEKDGETPITVGIWKDKLYVFVGDNVTGFEIPSNRGIVRHSDIVMVQPKRYDEEMSETKRVPNSRRYIADSFEDYGLYYALTILREYY